MGVKSGISCNVKTPLVNPVTRIPEDLWWAEHVTRAPPCEKRYLEGEGGERERERGRERGRERERERGREREREREGERERGRERGERGREKTGGINDE